MSGPSRYQKNVYAQHKHHSDQIDNVDDVTETVNAEIGGVQTVRLLGPFTITPATPNVVDPPDNGALLVTVAAGALVRAIPFNRVQWDSGAAELYVVISPAVDAVSSNLVSGADLTDIPNGLPLGMLNEPTSVSIPSKFGFAEDDCGVYAAAYPGLSGPITVGETDIYVLVAEPA